MKLMLRICLVFFASGFVLATISQKSFSDPHLGLALKTTAQNWDFYSPTGIEQSEPNRDLAVKFIVRGPLDKVTNVQPTLTLRTDKGNYTSAKAYAEKWLKEYPKFGYDLQSSKPTRRGALEGYDIELNSNLTNRRVKQFLVHRPDEIWVFTCTADQKNYKSAWAQCEEILETAQIR